jgi:ribose/xylose/arabinose/galactoside ABC-type transport system permease subunit
MDHGPSWADSVHGPWSMVLNRSPMRSFLSRNITQVALAVILLCLCAYLASRQSLFLSPLTAAQIFKYYSPMAMLALGMTFVILTGGIDLSVGFGMMLVMFAMAGITRDHPATSPVLAILAGGAASLVLGAFNGVSVAFFRIPAFIVSLAAMVAAYGITLVISQNQSIGNLPEAMRWLGESSFSLFGHDFPMMMPVVILSYVLGGLVLTRTAFGRRLIAIGSNREAARLSGINVPKIELASYLIMALCVWVAALMQLGINRNADPKVALSDNLELNAIAIVVIGGTSLAGGKGSVGGTALGALLLALIFYGLPLIGINEPSYKKMIQASIIFLGAVLDAVQRRYMRG